MSQTPELARPQIKGWCPSAFRPMESGDGLLVRAYTPNARVTLVQLQAAADIARTHGNGLVDLTHRAQIQIRGLTPASHVSALDDLAVAGLLASDTRSERLPHVLASPLAGLAPQAGFNADAFARALAARLAQIPALYDLPPKFLFVVEDEGLASLAEIDADIRFTPAPDDRIAIRIGGAKTCAALVSTASAIEAGCELARVFLTCGASETGAPRRMKQLVAAMGAARLFARASLSAISPPPEPTRAAGVEFFGFRDIAGKSVVGVGAPSGRLNADELDMIAEHAADAGAHELRLTPWRMLLSVVSSAVAAEAFVKAAAARGLIVSPNDPRRAIVACPGAPECSQALGETRSNLARLADLALQLAGIDGVGLHLSGCQKGCARPAAAPATLVATAQGFDLIANGRAADTPHRRNLDLDDAIVALKALAKDRTPCPTL